VTTCTQPGCTGTIVDGYCDVCGSPGPQQAAAAPVAAPTPARTPARAPAPAPPSRGPAAAAFGTGTPCTQPGCNGTIVDGYCDVCGSPGAGPAPGSAADLDRGPVDSGQVAGVGSTITRGSSRLGSTAFGSSRAVASGSKITRRVHAGSQRLRSARLGAGLTRVPPAPEIDASQAIMKNPEIPENKRSCPNCGAPVGRSRDGRPGRAEGF